MVKREFVQGGFARLPFLAEEQFVLLLSLFLLPCFTVVHAVLLREQPHSIRGLLRLVHPFRAHKGEAPRLPSHPETPAPRATRHPGLEQGGGSRVRPLLR